MGILSDFEVGSKTIQSLRAITIHDMKPVIGYKVVIDGKDLLLNAHASYEEARSEEGTVAIKNRIREELESLEIL